MLSNKKILIGITGSIAAYKITYLIRYLIKEGAEVQVILTPSAKDFVTPLTISTLSRNPICCDTFDMKNGKWNSHIDFGLWADVMMIVPATANTIAKMANGIVDNLLIASYMSARCPVFFAPAMDVDMFNHPSTQNNINKLVEYGNILIKPIEGELASGLTGMGKMEEPENIVKIVNEFLKKKDNFVNSNFLITSGPTIEKIDLVRYISNFSSGLMGYSIAEEAKKRGANITYISNKPQNNFNNLFTTSAQDMYQQAIDNFNSADVTILTAAVADYTPTKTFYNKLKKEDSELSIELKPTKDIAAELGRIKTDKQILVGFALESENEIENAKLKLKNKNLDIIVLNSLKNTDTCFGSDYNQITIIDKNNNVINYEKKRKTEVAKDILDYIFEYKQNM